MAFHVESISAPAVAASASFSAMRPAAPPAAHATHIAASASHSWLTHRTSLVNE
jgi:hypothetical protein